MTRRCPACGKKTDPLRAGHVAIFDDCFHYFCDRGCREDWLQGGRPNRSSYRPPSFASYRPPAFPAPARVPALAPPPAGTPGPHPTPGSITPGPHPPAPSPASGEGEPVTAVHALSPSPALPPYLSPSPALSPSPTPSPSPALSPSPTPSPSPALSSSPPPPPFDWPSEADAADSLSLPQDPGAPLLAAGLVAGLLGATFLLAGASSVIEATRIAFAFAGFTALLVRAIALPRDPADIHPAVILAPSLVAIGVAAYAWLTADPAHVLAATFAGVVVAGAAATTYLVERGRRSVRHELHRLAMALGLYENAAGQLRIGETTLVEAGATVPVDGTVVEGEATVQPWPLSITTAMKREGDAVVAGALVLEGSLRVLAAATENERAFARMALDPSRRADVTAPIAKLSRMLATHGASAFAALMALAGLANRSSAVEILLAATAGFAALGMASVGSIAAMHVARGVLEAHRHGIAYRSARDWDRAAGATVAVFSARGTLLLDEPELTDLEVVGPFDADRVLSLVAGVESARLGDPIAAAIQRAAAKRSLRPDAVRSPAPQPGLGMTAVASTGEPLLVGSRALMLREKVSIAAIEENVAKIEAHGRTVLLVALGGKLIAALGLQDGLRQGARAAVQHVLDAHIEPVLLSGDARETCEALGRALDIEHLRPEILPGERSREIERLAGGGAIVAVIGRAGRDDVALAAAGISVALGGAGWTTNDWGVSLASEEVRAGALALTLAQKARFQARVGLVLSLSPALVMALALAFGVVAPAYVPIAGLFGALLAAFHARATDSLRAGSMRG